MMILIFFHSKSHICPKRLCIFDDDVDDGCLISMITSKINLLSKVLIEFHFFFACDSVFLLFGFVFYQMLPPLQAAALFNVAKIRSDTRIGQPTTVPSFGQCFDEWQ